MITITITLSFCWGYQVNKLYTVKNLVYEKLTCIVFFDIFLALRLIGSAHQFIFDECINYFGIYI